MLKMKINKSSILLSLGLFLLCFGATTAITCYDCNSEYDPRCADPFDSYSIGTVNCNLQPPPDHLVNHQTAVLCRKTYQKVYGKIRVVRGCGYITDENHDDKLCVKRLGTHDVQANYCSCTTDLCNKGTTPTISLIYVFLLIIGVFTITNSWTEQFVSSILS